MTTGKNKDTINGDGGQLRIGPHGLSEPVIDARRHRAVMRFSVVWTGGDVVQARNKGTRGNPSRMLVRERMREMGTRGRLMRACHGQLLGSSVRTKSNLRMKVGMMN